MTHRSSNASRTTCAAHDRGPRAAGPTPSRGYPDYDPAEVRRLGRGDTRSWWSPRRGCSAPGARRWAPRGFRRFAGPAEAPTILLYAHHDVQPEGPIGGVGHGPVRTGPEERPPAHGRGAADDKSGIVAHAAAIRALLADGDLPATVKVIVEGEEECLTEHLPELVEGNADLLRADVAVIADGGNYRTGVPTLNTSIRGVTDVVVQVRVLPTAQHSGPTATDPDAISALARMIASLHHDGGRHDRRPEALLVGGRPHPEHEFRDECGVLESVELTGSGRIADRLFTGPAVAVLGIDAGDRRFIEPDRPSRARTRQPARRARRRSVRRARGLIDHLREHAPWGVEVTFDLDTGGSTGHGHLLDTSTPGRRRPRRADARTAGTRSRWAPADRSRRRCSPPRSRGSRS